MYGPPPAAPRDLNRPFRQATHHQHQMSSGGLLRYRSAPSSLLGEVCDGFLPLHLQQRNSRFPPPSPPPTAAATQMMYQKDGGGGGPNLIRQSSSPAGLFSHLSLENGYEDMRGIAGFRNGLLSQISEIENESIVGCNPNFSSPGLSHQLSLPKTASEVAAIEKLVRFEDSVPCRIRAKRGCATHPRSIAERVRRTRISERMRKLQELVPNMDTQTNTADMLDLAVDYIKDLQQHVRRLSDGRANCTCYSSSRR